MIISKTSRRQKRRITCCHLAIFCLCRQKQFICVN